MTTAAADSIPIPTPVVEHVHAAVLYKLGLVAEEIGNRTDLVSPALEEPLHRFDMLRSLVDTTKATYDGLTVEGSCRVELLDALSSWSKATAGVVETAASGGHFKEAGEYAAQLVVVTDFMASLTERVPA